MILPLHRTTTTVIIRSSFHMTKQSIFLLRKEKNALEKKKVTYSLYLLRQRLSQVKQSILRFSFSSLKKKAHLSLLYN